jgi:hypothetical protein
MFLKRLSVQADLEQINLDLEQVLTKTQWGVENQIGLTHRVNPVNDVWKDATGSLYDRENNIELVKESEFTELNADFPSYTKTALNRLGIVLGRVRYMRLAPKTGLSVHADNSVRYHLVLKTNPHAYIAQTMRGPIGAVCYHMPADSYFYEVDTKLEHFVYNGGSTDRIHLVICPR